MDYTTALVFFVFEPAVGPGAEFVGGTLGGIFLVAVVLGSVLMEGLGAVQSGDTYQIPEPWPPHLAIREDVAARGHEVSAVDHVQLHGITGR